MIHPKKDSLLTGRRIEFFHHNSLPEWGGGRQVDSFAVLHPRKGGKNRPLYVVFHSSGHDLFSCIGCTFAPGNHDIYRTPDDFYGLYVDCRANSEQDWWWGGINAKGEGNPRRRTEIQPVEKRIIATVQWVLKNYPVDPNRVYACGNSMGGSGALGIAMSHGEIFAAVKANVPAGVEHILSRCFGKEKVADLPVCIDYSAQNDVWSTGHEKLFRAAREHKFALYAYWAAFGHADNDPVMLPKNDLIHSLDWTSIRKDQAYPAFTQADCDDMIPWEHDLSSEAAGQVNGFFCWKNITDRSSIFRMLLYIVSPQDLKTSFTIPEHASADITLHRIQHFSIQPYEKICWEFKKQQGLIQVDSNGMITIPHLELDQMVSALTLTRKK